MAKANTPGKTARSMSENSARDSSTEKADGRARRDLNQAISTKETI